MEAGEKTPGRKEEASYDVPYKVTYESRFTAIYDCPHCGRYFCKDRAGTVVSGNRCPDLLYILLLCIDACEAAVESGSGPIYHGKRDRPRSIRGGADRCRSGKIEQGAGRFYADIKNTPRLRGIIMLQSVQKTGSF